MDEKVIKILEEIRDIVKKNSEVAEKVYQNGVDMQAKSKNVIRNVLFFAIIFFILTLIIK